jgi:hypothetical protein
MSIQVNAHKPKLNFNQQTVKQLSNVMDPDSALFHSKRGKGIQPSSLTVKCQWIISESTSWTSFSQPGEFEK